MSAFVFSMVVFSRKAVKVSAPAVSVFGFPLFYDISSSVISCYFNAVS